MTGPYDNTTYANEFGELIGPILKLVRSTGFFEAPVFLTSMTIVSIILFVKIVKQLNENGTIGCIIPEKHKRLWLSFYYTMSFLCTNSLAVAFKTLIVEEMDYETHVWFMSLVSPLHFYITSVASAYLWLMWRNRKQALERFLCLYIQIGFLGGYYAGIYRLLHEPFELTDVTTGMSGLFFLIWFGFLNADIYKRVTIPKNVTLQTQPEF